LSVKIRGLPQRKVQGFGSGQCLGMQGNGPRSVQSVVLTIYIKG
jgi:hypothetical protein